MGLILKTLPTIRIVTVVLHGLTLLFRFLLRVKSLQYGDGSNKLTDEEQ